MSQFSPKDKQCNYAKFVKTEECISFYMKKTKKDLNDHLFLKWDLSFVDLSFFF